MRDITKRAQPGTFYAPGPNNFLSGAPQQITKGNCASRFSHRRHLFFNSVEFRYFLLLYFLSHSFFLKFFFFLVFFDKNHWIHFGCYPWIKNRGNEWDPKTLSQDLGGIRQIGLLIDGQLIQSCLALTRISKSE